MELPLRIVSEKTPEIGMLYRYKEQTLIFRRKETISDFMEQVFSPRSYIFIDIDTGEEVELDSLSGLTPLMTVRDLLTTIASLF